MLETLDHKTGIKRTDGERLQLPDGTEHTQAARRRDLDGSARQVYIEPDARNMSPVYAAERPSV
jgi:hypothetical protein